MHFLSQVKKLCLNQAHHYFVRDRIVNQMVFLSQHGYFKKKITVSASAKKSAKEFKVFLEKWLSPKRFAKDASLLILHSLVITLLIAWGDHRIFRKKLGAKLEKFLGKPKLALMFEWFPNLYASFLANLPPLTVRGKSLTLTLIKQFPG